MYGQPQNPRGVLPAPVAGGYPQLRPAAGGSMSLPPARSMGSLPAPSAALRTSMSPTAAPAQPGVVRSYSGNLPRAPMQSTPQGTPRVVQTTPIPGGQQIQGGSLSIPNVGAQPARQNSGPAPRAFQSLGPPATGAGGLGERASPFGNAGHAKHMGPQVAQHSPKKELQASQMSTIPGSEALSAQPNGTPPVLSSRSYRSDAPTEQTHFPPDTMQAAPQAIRTPQWASGDQFAEHQIANVSSLQSLAHPRVDSRSPSPERRSPSPELPLSHRYPQARISSSQSPSMPRLEPKMDIVAREAPPALRVQDRIAAAGYPGVYQDTRPRQAVEISPVAIPPTPPEPPQSYHQRERFEDVVFVQTRQGESHSAFASQVYRGAGQQQVHHSPPAQQVIPTRQPASVQHNDTPPRSTGFLSSISNGPASPEKTATFQRNAQAQSSSSHAQQPQRGIEFSQAPKPIWQRDEVVAPAILAAPLAGFLSTMMF